MSTLITFDRLTAGNKVSAVTIFGFNLPFPRNMEVETEYLWEAEELGMIGSALKNGQFDATTMDGAKQALTTAGYGVFASATQAAAASGAVSGQLGNTAVAVNPKEEVLFKGVKHRRFNMVFDLAPLSAVDSANTMYFLRKLHEKAAPDLLAGGSFWRYPDITSVAVNGAGGMIVNRGNCAITAINANLSPDQIWAAFHSGKPVHVIVTISFMELDLPSKTKDATLFG